LVLVSNSPELQICRLYKLPAEKQAEFNTLYSLTEYEMKKNTLQLVLCGAVMLASLQTFAQKAEQALSVLLKDFPSEKLYLHYDKEYYVSGETIWFKAYLFNDGKPSSLSQNLFLQFADSKGNVVASQRYPVMGAVIKGNIHIPDSLPPGNYYVRALTPAMLNGGEDFIYTKNLYVFRPSAPAPAAPATPPAVSLQFFPESGHLVAGILCVTAFKATDQYGAPVAVEGILKTEDGTTLTSFRSLHDGIGKLQFKPQAGKKYIAEVETAAGKRTYALPDVLPGGINLKIQDEKGGKKFLIARSEKDKALFAQLQIVVQLNNHVVFESEIDFENYLSIAGGIGTDSLPSGILHFTVFNKEGMPLAERLSFNDNGEYRSKATINPVITATAKREANELELLFPDGMQRSCSVAIIDLPGTPFSSNESIVSRFLLTSDLRGYIHNPAWYFEQQNDTTRQALDNLLLTHGWTRFNWAKILANEYPVVRYTDRPLINLAGVVADPRTKTPLAYGKLGFFVEGEDSATQTIEAVVDEKGRFKIDSAAFFGKTQLFYGYTDKNEKQKPALVLLDENAAEQAVQLVPAGLAAKTASANPFLFQQKEELERRQQQVKTALDQVKELANVNIVSNSSRKPVDIVNDKYTTGAFRGTAKEVLDNVNDPVTDRSLNSIDYIKNRIQQVEYAGNRFVSRKNFSLSSGQKWPVAIFVNEQLADVTQLVTIRAVDIALVKYFDAGFVGVGSNFPGGAISVYTKEKLPEERKPDKLESVVYNGYTITKEFYNPDYSNKTIRHPQSDQRTTLYWNPDIFTDSETRSVKVRFYNNDFSTAFRVVMEGFDASGKLIHTEKIIKSN
jgi:hypothetical protein